MNGTALITGGGIRIGKAIVEQLAQQGYRVAIHYNTSKTPAQKLLNSIKKNGGQGKLFKCNLSNPKAVIDLIKKVKKQYPDLQVLVNSASIFEEKSFLKTDLALLTRALNINLISPMVLTREFALRCKKGLVVNILDTRINKNSISHFAYLISKKSLADFTKMAAKELSPHIRVNGIAPGLILPPKGQSKNYLQKRAKSLPLKKSGQLKDIQQAVEYFTQASFVTGQILYVDGGEHIL